MKRFTETDKWKDPQFLKMRPGEKLVWFYIIDNCDNAGFIEWDAEICAMFTGMKLDHVEGAFKGLTRGLLGAKNSNWYHVPKFLKHQKNLPLNKDNNAHKQIIALVEDKRSLFPCVAKELLGADEGLTSPIGKGRGNSKVKVKDYTPEFEEWWKLYKKGNKRNAFEAWSKQDIVLDTMLEQTRQYMRYCASIDRPMLDGQGFINQRAFETEWTHSAQGTKAGGQTAHREVRGL